MHVARSGAAEGPSSAAPRSLCKWARTSAKHLPAARNRVARGLGFKCTRVQILANSRVALGFLGPFQVLEIGASTCAPGCGGGHRACRATRLRQGKAESQGSCHWQFRPAVLGTQLGSITEQLLGKFERGLAQLFQSRASPWPPLALEEGTSVWLWLSVIRPETRQARHRPWHTGRSPASAGGGHLRPSVLPALCLCPQHRTPAVLSAVPLLCKQASGWSPRAAFPKVPWTGWLE